MRSRAATAVPIGGAKWRECGSQPPLLAVRGGVAGAMHPEESAGTSSAPARRSPPDLAARPSLQARTNRRPARCRRTSPKPREIFAVMRDVLGAHHRQVHADRQGSAMSSANRGLGQQRIEIPCAAGVTKGSRLASSPSRAGGEARGKMLSLTLMVRGPRARVLDRHASRPARELARTSRWSRAGRIDAPAARLGLAGLDQP